MASCASIFGNSRNEGLAREDPRDRILQRKIENTVETGIDSIESRTSALEERRERRIAVVDFAHDLETGVACVDGCRPVAPEASRHIGTVSWRMPWMPVLPIHQSVFCIR
jgi:hypothetical protein